MRCKKNDSFLCSLNYPSNKECEECPIYIELKQKMAELTEGESNGL